MHPAALSRIALSLSCSASLLGLTACTVGPDYQRPMTPLASAAFPSGRTDLASHVSHASIDIAWWQMFNDPTLSKLEQDAAKQNLDIEAATARMGASRAQLRIAGASSFPVVGANASELRERSSPDGILSLVGTPGVVSATAANGADAFGTTAVSGEDGSAPFNIWQYGFDASWELDLWGKARRTREAAKANEEASQYDAVAVYLSTSAEVARVYLSLRATQVELQVATKNRDIAQANLQLTRHREGQGVATRFETANAAAQLATVTASLPALAQRETVQMNALALLLDEAPHALDSLLRGTEAIPKPPPTLPVGMASQLARRRPDILVAEAKLHAATAEIGVAKADFYPTVSLSGSLGMQALQFTEGGDWSARQFAFGPVLHLPIFEGGRLMGTLSLRKERQQEAAIRYRQTVLNAWHEVDNALNDFQSVQLHESALADTVAQNKIAWQSAKQRYAQGAIDYLSVLTAERDMLSSEMSEAQGRADVSLAMVRLYKALGGGWAGQGEAMAKTVAPSTALASAVGSTSAAGTSTSMALR